MDLNEELFQSVEALTFDDVLIVPGYTEVLPSEVDVHAHLTQETTLNIPILSAAMDTVTEAHLAIALACEGGIGILHRNMAPDAQAHEVDKVKEVEIESRYPNAARDGKGRLLCGAAVGVGTDLEQRVDLLIQKGVDILVVDTAHGHSKGVIQAIQRIHKNWPEMPVIAGNVVTTEGTKSLIEAGVAAVKVGVGAGSICTTRVVAGAGMPQLSAIHACAQAAKPFNIPIVADGGIKYSGDIVKAIVAGADAVMLGSLMAGLEESPGEVVNIEGHQFKEYRGMGSMGAMRGYGKDRYGSGQGASGKSVPEGIEGRVPYKGALSDFIYQLVGGLRSGMGYAGARNLEELRSKTKLVRITRAGFVESHPHGITITKQAPNYPLNSD